MDALDRINFKLKAEIDVGDEVECNCSIIDISSGEELVSKGTRYSVLGIEDRGFGDFSLVTTSNEPGKIATGFMFNRVYRAGKLIWDRHAALIRDWDDALRYGHPYPRTDADEMLMAELGW
jgi:hypothetical protein